MKFLVKTKLGWRNASLKVRENISDEEFQVLRAVFQIEGNRGSLFGKHEQPLSWGYASRKWICKAMGKDQTDSNLRNVSTVLRELQAHNYLRIHRVARDGEINAANHILLICLSLVAAVFESPIYNIISDHIVGVCGSNSKDFEPIKKPEGGLWERAKTLGLPEWRECLS